MLRAISRRAPYRSVVERRLGVEAGAEPTPSEREKSRHPEHRAKYTQHATRAVTYGRLSTSSS